MALDLPVITVRDMVRAQAMLLDRLGIETLFSVAGGSMGGMQVLQWAATYPERVFAALPIAAAARHSSQNIAFHEVGRQAVMADPEWRGGRYLERRREPAEGPRRRPHGGAHHLPVRRGAAPQVRAQPAGSRQADLRLRRRLPDRILSPPPGLDLRRPLRRQLLSLHDAGDGLFRPRRRVWRPARQRLPRHAGRASASSPSPPTGCSRRSRTRRWCARSTPPAASVSFVEIETDRGHDAFLLDEPELFATVRGFLSAAARCPRHRLSAMNALPDRAAAATSPASTISPSPSWCRRARACSTSAAATAACSTLLEATRGVDGRGIEISQKGVNECVARGLSVDPGRRRHRPRRLSRRRLRLRHPQPDAAGDAPAARRARADAAHRAEGDRLLPQFRPLADRAAARA